MILVDLALTIKKSSHATCSRRHKKHITTAIIFQAFFQQIGIIYRAEGFVKEPILLVMQYKSSNNCTASDQYSPRLRLNPRGGERW